MRRSTFVIRKTVTQNESLGYNLSGNLKKLDAYKAIPAKAMKSPTKVQHTKPTRPGSYKPPSTGDQGAQGYTPTRDQRAQGYTPTGDQAAQGYTPTYLEISAIQKGQQAFQAHPMPIHKWDFNPFNPISTHQYHGVHPHFTSQGMSGYRSNMDNQTQGAQQGPS